MATMDAMVVIKVVSPVESPSSRLVTPTRPKVPGTSSQNPGRKLAKAAGPFGCREAT